MYLMNMSFLHMMMRDENWDEILKLGMGLHLANKMDAAINELKHQKRNTPKLNTQMVNGHVGDKMSQFATENWVGKWYIVRPWMIDTSCYDSLIHVPRPIQKVLQSINGS